MELKKLNSITKYPSILTYHTIGERGKLDSVHSEEKTFPIDQKIYAYEKVDGENSRIILLNSDYSADYFIGSREELLYAKGDRIGNPYGNIADFLNPLAEQMDWIFRNDRDKALTVIYQESYGGKTKAAKNYTDNKTQGYRVFDVFSLTYSELTSLLNLPIEKIAEWRDRGGQPFYSEKEKHEFINKWSLEAAPLVDEMKGSSFPLSLDNTYEYLKNFEKTKVGINTEGKSEGIIVRTHDRQMIRKIRFEDYERTFRTR
ncbi:RNA ligase family protein [Paenibacillus sp. FSL H3-0333]|uniref:RNA ligase family protein n=1 Tax=Paenibacillus sp. FSL H3-0333 TaxID=2921373 RepID=UPI0030F6935B